LAYRWIAYHSALKASLGDSIIFGASSVAQVEETLSAIADGALKKDTVDAIAAIWKTVDKDSPLNNYHSSN
jgi:aflatoxin B1 aldehyde reductase